MSEAEQFERTGLGLGEDYRLQAGRNDLGRNDFGRNENGRKDPDRHDPRSRQSVPEPLPRAVGSPLPMGSSAKSALALSHSEGKPGRTNAPPPGRALSVQARAETEPTSGVQWALGLMKQAVPFVQRLLPLLDGQIATAVANLLAPHPHTPPPAPKVDLQPLEHGLADLQIQHRDLKDQLADQNTSLKRVNDQLEMVREAVDRNTLEQQELMEDLRTMGKRVKLFAWLFLDLLIISVLLNIFLFLHIQRVLP
jgi:hypothetical protein